MRLLVAGILLVATVILTWPLSRHLASGVPGPDPRPLHNTWVIGWVAGELTHAAVNPSTLRNFWNANIFFPEAGTLGFSEHLIAQSVMVLPVYWLTGNLLLCYNVAFVASFVLTGLGTFLLVRTLTASTLAAIIAAFIAAFNPYRLEREVNDLAALTVQWLPLVWWALYRYGESDRRRWLVLAGAAWIALNLSSLSFARDCAPLVLAFAVFTVVDTSRWRQGRTWLELWAMGAAVALVTLLLAPDPNAQQRLVMRFASGTSVASVMAARQLESWWALAIPLVWCALAIVGALLTRTRRTTLAVSAFVVLLLVATVWATAATVTMIVLSVFAGYGVAWCERRWQRPAMVAAVLSVVAMVMMLPSGIRMDAPAVATTLAAPPAYLTPAASPPTIYRAVETLSRSAVLAEFPFGDSGYDLRYMFFSTTHRRRLLNGYSKTSPPTFLARQRVLAQPLLDPAIAAQALAGATHVIVHRHAWKDNTGLLVGGWLEAFGARAVAEGDGAVLYELAANEGLARTELEVEGGAPGPH